MERKHPGQLHLFGVPPYLFKPYNSDTVSIIANFSVTPRAPAMTGPRELASIDTLWLIVGLEIIMLGIEFRHSSMSGNP